MQRSNLLGALRWASAVDASMMPTEAKALFSDLLLSKNNKALASPLICKVIAFRSTELPWGPPRCVENGYDSRFMSTLLIDDLF